MPEEQATGVVQIVTGATDQRMADLATRDELREGLAGVDRTIEAEIARVNHKIETEIAMVNHKIEAEIATVNHKIDTVAAELRGEIIASQNKVILWVVGAMFTVPGVYIAIAKAVGLF